jgi:hypothetical protein
MVWRRATLRRATAEAVLIFTAGRLVALIPPAVWPAPLFPLAPLAWLGLMFLAPIWATLRVVSTRREKMSRRFWWLGPRLATYCTLADAALTLLTRTAAPPREFVQSEAILLLALAVFFTIAVVCTRLANGGFLRFTMPAGNGRVTL